MKKVNRLQWALVVSGLAMGFSLSVQAAGEHEKGDFFLKGRLMGVVPDSSSDPFTALGVTGTVEIEPASAPVDAMAINFAASYFFTDHLALEFSIDTDYQMVVNATGDFTVPLNAAQGSTAVADVRFISPTLFAQYHIAPSYWIDPYVGVGVHYSYPFRDTATKTITDAYDAYQVFLDLDSVFSWGLQAGADVYLGKDWIMGQEWYGNIDARYLDSTTTFAIVPFGNQFSTAVKDENGYYGAGVGYYGPYSIGDVQINPMVYSMGIGTRF